MTNKTTLGHTFDIKYSNANIPINILYHLHSQQIILSLTFLVTPIHTLQNFM